MEALTWPASRCQLVSRERNVLVRGSPHSIVPLPPRRQGLSSAAAGAPLTPRHRGAATVSRARAAPRLSSFRGLRRRATVATRSGGEGRSKIASLRLYRVGESRAQRSAVAPRAHPAPRRLGERPSSFHAKLFRRALTSVPMRSGADPAFTPVTPTPHLTQSTLHPFHEPCGTRRGASSSRAMTPSSAAKALQVRARAPVHGLHGLTSERSVRHGARRPLARPQRRSKSRGCHSCRVWAPHESRSAIQARRGPDRQRGWRFRRQCSSR